MTNKRPEPSRVRVRPGAGAPPSVDGHPGFVAADNAAWAYLAALTIMASGLLSGTGDVLTQARSAAWWVTFAGTLLGALLVWLPLCYFMRAPDGSALTLDEALRGAFGNAAGVFLTLLIAVSALLEAALLLRTLGGMVPLYLADGASETRVMYAALAALFASLFHARGRGFSRSAWALRFVLGGLLAVSLLLMLENAEVHHLFPLLGPSVGETLSALPPAMGNGAAAALLGLVPRFTGSAKPLSLRLGTVCALSGSAACGVLTLFAGLSVSPLAVGEASTGGARLMLAIEYVSRAQFYRICYHFALLLLFLFACGAALAGCAALLCGAWRLKKHRAAVLTACLVCAAAALCPDAQFYQALRPVRTFGLLPVAAPVWAGLSVAALKRRKEKKAA